MANSFPAGLPVSVSGPDPFAKISGPFGNVSNTVANHLGDASTRATTSFKQALASIEKIGSFDLDGSINFPSFPGLTGNLSADFKPGSLGGSGGFGTVSYSHSGGNPSDVSMGDVNIPEFQSSVISLSLPPAPAAIDTSGKPALVSVDMSALTIPNDPVYNTPVLPSLVDVVLPAFTPPTIESFSITAPVFTESAISATLQWAEPTYLPEVIDEVIAQVKKYMLGGTGIPAAVEKAIFERGNDREDILVTRQVAQATDLWATRGFTMPSGVLLAQTNIIQQDALVKKQGFNREITIKMAEWEIENIRFAVQQGIAAENVLSNIFLNQAARNFEAAKYRVEALISVYNAQVAVFTARMDAYKISADVYKTKIEAQLGLVEIYKAQIEGEKAKVDVNKSLVDMYTAQWQGVASAVDVYKAQVAAVATKADVMRSQIEAYKASVEAYSVGINAEMTKFEAYKAQIQGEVAKVGILDAEAKIFSAKMQGYSAAGEIAKQHAMVLIENKRANAAVESASYEADKVNISAQSANIQAAAQAFTAETQRFAAESSAAGEASKASTAAYEVSNRLVIAAYDASLRQYDSALHARLQLFEAKMQAAAQAASASATLAAGAMSAVHVSASSSASVGMSGAAQVSDSSTRATQTSASFTETTSN